jgi:hypothetical protein
MHNSGMDNATLVRPDIEAGRQLLQGLDEAKFDVQAAFWFYGRSLKNGDCISPRHW